MVIYRYHYEYSKKINKNIKHIKKQQFGVYKAVWNSKIDLLFL